MNLTSRGKVGLLAALIGLGLASTAHAQQQVTQTVTWSAANQQGMTGGGSYLCYQNDRYLGYNPGLTMTFTWTDTTMAPLGSVRIDVSINSHYFYSGLGFQFAVNSVIQSNTLTTTTQNTNCSGNQLFTITFETGITTWNPGGTNTITMNHTTGNGYFGFSPNQSYMAQFLITQLNLNPDPPTNLGQIGPDGKGIGVGGICASPNITLRATVSDPDNDECYLEAEVAAPTVFFTNTPNWVGAPSPSGTFATIAVLGLAPGTYHWQVRAGDEWDFLSPYVSFGGNSEVTKDFDINLSANVAKPVDDLNHGGGDCNISAGIAGGLMSPALLGLALLAFGLARKK